MEVSEDLQEAQMKCPRCHGIMVFEKFYGSQEHFFGWRCVHCGEIVDQVILEKIIRAARVNICREGRKRPLFLQIAIEGGIGSDVMQVPSPQ
jgi:DNA-directed RNA polymerase subunit RPC12/RpoP